MIFKTYETNRGRHGMAGDGSGQPAWHLNAWHDTIYGNLDNYCVAILARGYTSCTLRRLSGSRRFPLIFTDFQINLRHFFSRKLCYRLYKIKNPSGICNKTYFLVELSKPNFGILFFHDFCINFLKSNHIS